MMAINHSTTGLSTAPEIVDRERSQELLAQLSRSLQLEAELGRAGVRDKSGQLAGQHGLSPRVEASLHISVLDVEQPGSLQLQRRQVRHGEAIDVALSLGDSLEHASRVVVAHPVGGELLDLGLDVGSDPVNDQGHDEEVGHDVHVDETHEGDVAGDGDGQAAGLHHLVDLGEGDRDGLDGQILEEASDVQPV